MFCIEHIMIGQIPITCLGTNIAITTKSLEMAGGICGCLDYNLKCKICYEQDQGALNVVVHADDAIPMQTAE